MRARLLVAVLVVAAGAVIVFHAGSDTTRTERGGVEHPHALSDRREPGDAPADEIITIRILSAEDDTPLKGAFVRPYYYDDYEEFAGAETDDAGKAVLGKPTKSDGEFRVFLSGHIPEVYRYQRRDPETITIRLRAAATLRGRVVRYGSGKAVEGAEVETWRWPAVVTVRTGKDGVFEIGDLLHGSIVRLVARYSNYVTTERWFRVGEEARIVIGEGGVIRGTVVDERGAPVAGAKVYFLETDDAEEAEEWELAYQIAWDEPPQTRTRADGSFLIRGLSQGQAWVAIARTDDCREGRSPRAVFDKPNETREYRIELRPKAHVVVRAFHPNGSPVRGARVFLRYSRPCVERTPGVYDSGPVDPGTYDGEVDLKGWGTREFQCKVTSNDPVDVEVRMLAGGILRGRVTDVPGTPVPRIDVEFRSEDQCARTETDKNGRFLVQGLERKPGTLFFEHPDRVFVPQERKVRPGDPDVTLVLERAPVITGRLDPVPESRELHFRLGGQVEFRSHTVRVDATGRFRLRGMPAEKTFLLVLEVDDWVPLTFFDVHLAPESNRDFGVLQPSAGVTLEGVVRDNYGQLLDGAAVNLVSTLRDVRAFQIAGPSGAFRFENLPKSPAELVVYSEEHVGRRIRFDVLEDRGVLEVLLIRAGYLKGTADKQDLDVKLVPLWRGDPLEFHAEGGVFSENVVPGRYRIRFLGRDGPVVEIKEGETSQVALSTR